MDVTKIRELLKNDRMFQLKALKLLAEKQTAGELAGHSTHEKNDYGFTAFDAGILTSFYEQFESRHFLSTKQFALLSDKLPKYAAQLAHILAEAERSDKTWSEVVDELASDDSVIIRVDPRTSDAVTLNGKTLRLMTPLHSVVLKFDTEHAAKMAYEAALEAEHNGTLDAVVELLKG